jgi:hypothetical protein
MCKRLIEVENAGESPNKRCKVDDPVREKLLNELNKVVKRVKFFLESRNQSPDIGRCVKDSDEEFKEIEMYVASDAAEATGVEINYDCLNEIEGKFKVLDGDEEEEGYESDTDDEKDEEEGMTLRKAAKLVVDQVFAHEEECALRERDASNDGLSWNVSNFDKLAQQFVNDLSQIDWKNETCRDVYENVLRNFTDSDDPIIKLIK